MMERLREIFLKNIVSEAEKQRLDYKDVADRAGLSRSGIYKIMNGQREPGFDNIDRIAIALGVSPHSLLLEPGKAPRITAREALEALSDFIEKTSITPHVPSLDPATEGSPGVRELIDTVRSYPDLVEVLLNVSKRYVRKASTEQAKTRRG